MISYFDGDSTGGLFRSRRNGRSLFGITSSSSGFCACGGAERQSSVGTRNAAMSPTSPSTGPITSSHIGSPAIGDEGVPAAVSARAGSCGAEAAPAGTTAGAAFFAVSPSAMREKAPDTSSVRRMR